ncbi:MAG: hypothetical protein ACXWYD_17175, partial [Candidatus Binatia bacterium]
NRKNRRDDLSAIYLAVPKTIPVFGLVRPGSSSRNGQVPPISYVEGAPNELLTQCSFDYSQETRIPELLKNHPRLTIAHRCQSHAQAGWEGELGAL